jgi:RIO-like serine/threonine protein kinase
MRVLEQALTQHGVLQPEQVKTSAALIIMRVAAAVELMRELLAEQVVPAVAGQVLERLILLEQLGLQTPVVVEVVAQISDPRRQLVRQGVLVL